MQRKNIIMVGVLFSMIAVGAGYFVAGSSATSGVGFGAIEPTPQAAGSATNIPPTAAPTTPTTPAATEPTAAPSVPAPSTAAAPVATAVPTATVPAPTPAPAPSATTTGPRFAEYTVQRGDVLLAIAQRYGVTVKDIMAHNEIPNPDSLRVGQVLRIPQP